MNEVWSPTMFKWLMTAFVGVLAVAWLVYDAINLYKARHLDRTDPIVRDRHFGYVIGMVCGIVGIVGCLKFHGVLG